MRIGVIRRFPACWQSILKAWTKLRPHWNPDLSAWSTPQALSFILYGTYTAQNSFGIPLVMVLERDPSTELMRLLTDTVARFRFHFPSTSRIITALQRLYCHPSSLDAQLVPFLGTLPLPAP